MRGIPQHRHVYGKHRHVYGICLHRYYIGSMVLRDILSLPDSMVSLWSSMNYNSYSASSRDTSHTLSSLHLQTNAGIQVEIGITCVTCLYHHPVYRWTVSPSPLKIRSGEREENVSMLCCMEWFGRKGSHRDGSKVSRALSPSILEYQAANIHPASQRLVPNIMCFTPGV